MNVSKKKKKERVVVIVQVALKKQLARLHAFLHDHYMPMCLMAERPIEVRPSANNHFILRQRAGVFELVLKIVKDKSMRVYCQ